MKISKKVLTDNEKPEIDFFTAEELKKNIEIAAAANEEKVEEKKIAA